MSRIRRNERQPMTSMSRGAQRAHWRLPQSVTVRVGLEVLTPIAHFYLREIPFVHSPGALLEHPLAGVLGRLETVSSLPHPEYQYTIAIHHRYQSICRRASRVCIIYAQLLLMWFQSKIRRLSCSHHFQRIELLVPERGLVPRIFSRLS